MFMATRVHIPRALLDEVDRRARELAVSRNRLIVRLIAEGLARTTEWSPGFFEDLAAANDRGAVDEMLEAIRSHRRSKKPATP
jgi:hypothetical protein